MIPSHNLPLINYRKLCNFLNGILIASLWPVVWLLILNFSSLPIKFHPRCFLSTVLVYAASDFLPRLGFLKASIELHRKLLVIVFSLPSSFFEVNPTGRILSRFSKDIDVIDGPLPSAIQTLFGCITQVSKRGS